LIGQTNSVISEAVDVIRKSKTIVVIGYTFPLYNRLVDLDYFNESTLYAKTLVIQDPRAENIQNDVIDGFFRGAKSNGTIIKVKTNCDSFFIPNNIFAMP
jgi:hypothetical protein